MATVKETNKEFFRRVVDALNERGGEAFAETHTKDVVHHDHDETLHGVDAAVEHEWTLYDAFPDMEQDRGRARRG